ncbi:TenA family protein [Acidianus sulfidivorans JP7]|uniref:TenA family transcriptional regulator n=1 Tax=Acidianus sulfidivorans JP7 TaxID=619593 RepID=A0A2U9IKC1_9CREN|nr:TenA family protein [Acidianus sulfidivorans JP7]
MKTSEKLKEIAGDLWYKYTRHEFVQKMKEGSLDIDTFRYYLIQDSKYVEMMLKSLLTASNKGPIDKVGNILKSIFETRDKGMEVHSWLLSQLNISHEEISRTGYSVSNYAYTRHLYYYATIGWDYFLAAWAPCMWGYYEIGTYVKDSPNQLYARWAEFYASNEYKKRVDTILDALDSIPYREELRVPFIDSVKFEIMFWESAINKIETDII